MSLTTSAEKEIYKLLLLGKVPTGGSPVSRNTDVVGADVLYLGLSIGAKIDETSGDIPVINEPTNQLGLVSFLGRANARDSDNNYYRIPLDDAKGDGSNVEVFSEAVIDAHEEDAVANSAIVEFGQASNNWGTIYSWFITDTPDLTLPGNIRVVGHMTFPLLNNMNDLFLFQVGALALIVK